MGLEATMMIIDNSEYMRNGDYVPTRFEAQSDAITTVFQTKIDANPENTVGIMTMAGKSPEVLVTNTKDIGQILQAIHQTKGHIGGTIDIPTSINVAQLALKHRENKNLRPRLIVFVGSPLDGPGADEKSMIRLAKKLKKNSVAVDIVCYGDGIEESSEDGKTVLQSFVENADNSGNSHMITVPPGNTLLSDVILHSSILASDRSAGIPEQLVPGGSGDVASSSGGPSSGFEFGVDPSLDPELAMALRMSMEEAQAREAAEAAAANTSSSSAPAAQTSKPPVPEPIPAEPTDNEEEALLQQAIAMSTVQEQDVDMDASSAAARPREDVSMEDEEDEEAAIARAIAMSMEQDENNQTKK